MLLSDRLSCFSAICCFIVLLSSAASVSAGAVLLLFYQLGHLGFVSALFPAAPYCMVAAGVISIPCGLYGLCASASRNKVHLWVLSAVLVGLCLLQVACALVAIELRLTIEMRTFMQVG